MSLTYQLVNTDSNYQSDGLFNGNCNSKAIGEAAFTTNQYYLTYIRPNIHRFRWKYISKTKDWKFAMRTGVYMDSRRSELFRIGFIKNIRQYNFKCNDYKAPF
jgi:hypothetical protein